MKKILTTYKRNPKNNTLEITHKLITENNLKVTLKESVEYTKEKEIELLKEIREELQLKMDNYYHLINQNRQFQTLLYQEYTSASLGLLAQTPVSLAIFSLFSLLSIRDTKDFIINSIELKRIEKGAFYISNEEMFKIINSQLGLVKSKIKSSGIKNKINELCTRNEDISINNITEFSTNQLRKINNFYNTVLK